MLIFRHKFVKAIYSALGISALVFLASSCSPTTVKKRSDVEKGRYSEDLSYLRKDYVAKKAQQDVVEKKSTDIIIKEIPDSYTDIKPQYDIAYEIDSVLRIIENERADVNYIRGYTIQVFTGVSRDKAFYARDKVYAVLSNSEPTIKYYQPNYQVKVGSYFTQLDAMEDFRLLKESFNSAIIIPHKIPANTIKDY